MKNRGRGSSPLFHFRLINYSLFQVLNLDDVVSFDKLNRDLASGDFSPTQFPPTSEPFSKSSTSLSELPSPYLVGPNRDILKIHVVIAPMEQVCNPSLLLRRNKVKSS